MEQISVSSHRKDLKMINAKQARAMMNVDKETFENCIYWADTWIQKSALEGKTKTRLLREDDFHKLTPKRAEGTQQAIVKFLEELGFNVEKITSNDVVEWFVSWDKER